MYKINLLQKKRSYNYVPIPQLNSCISKAFKKNIIMANLTILFTCLALTLSASTYSQVVSISGKDVTAPQLFETINKQTGYAFVLDNALLKKIPPLALSEVSVPLETILDKALKRNGFDYIIKHKTIIVSVASTAFKNTYTQKRRISGQVVDEKGKPLLNATIKITGSRISILTTDKIGTFNFEHHAGDRQMQVSYIGYHDEIIHIKPTVDNYIVKLSPKTTEIEDVIVTGIFDRPKESFTGSAVKFTKEDLKMAGNRNLLKTLGNLDPSFDIREIENFGSDPNKLPQIEIRGTTTISTVNALQNGVKNRTDMNLPLFILDGFEVSLERVMDMNQVDVESVTILKDASAKAIYGSRAANGVVVITSIVPASGTLRINYAAGLNLEIADLSSYNLLNAKEKLDLEMRAGYYTDNTNLTNHFNLQQEYYKNLRAVASGIDTDWKNIPVRDGIGQYHKLDITGGDQKFRYILNGSYNQIKGGLKGSDRDNFNGGVTFHYNSGKFRVANNISVGFNNASNSPYGRYIDYVTMNPYWSPVDEQGKLNETFGTQQRRNPLLAPYSTDFSTTAYHNIRNATNIDWEIATGLRLAGNIGFTYQSGESDNYESPNSTNQFFKTVVEDKGWYTKGYNKRQSYQLGSTLSYGKVFGLHTVFAGVNAQLLETKTYNSTIIASGFLNENMNDIAQAIRYAQARPNSRETTARTIGLTTTGNYNYDNRYYADLTFRRDGASSFGSQSRWAPFWSMGLGWTVSNEQFVKKYIPQINTMRMRYSYGVTGSMNFQPYDAMTIYEYKLEDLYRNIIPATVQAFGNPNLKWQNTKENNVGLDLALFSNRFNLTANYYWKTTVNLVSEANLRYSNGYSVYKENIGTIQNKGWDMNGSYIFWRDTGKDINWALTAGFYKNKNTLVKLSQAIKDANASVEKQHLSYGIIPEYREGQSIDEIFVLNSPGVDVLTGEVLYRNSKGEINTGATGMDKMAVGTSVPKIHARFGTNVRWKGLNVSVGFAARLGGKKLNNTLLSRVENAFIYNNMDRRILDNRWMEPGDISAYKNILSKNATLANNRFVFTENTVTLNNINIFYDMPNTISSKMRLRRLTVGVTMSDVFYWSNIQLERGLDYPYSIKPMFTLQATF